MEIILLLYLADLVLHLAWRQHRGWTKLLLMPLLILYCLLSGSKEWLIFLALLAGLGGDYSLLHKDSRAWFMTGLASFLVGHVAYGLLFLKSTNWLAGAPAWLFLLPLPYLALLLLFFRRLGPRLGRMRPAILIYCATICGMSLAALSRLIRFEGPAFWLPLLGSLLFIFSDSTLAMDHFGASVQHRLLKVMLSYGLAQLLIVIGIVGVNGI